MMSFQQVLSNAPNLQPSALAQVIKEHGISIIPALHLAGADFSMLDGIFYGDDIVSIITILGMESIPALHKAGVPFEKIYGNHITSIITQLGLEAIPALRAAGTDFSYFFGDHLAALATTVGASIIPELIKAGADFRTQTEGAFKALSSELQLAIAHELQHLSPHYLCAADEAIFQNEAQSILDQALIQASCHGAPKAIIRTMLKLLKTNDLSQLSELYASHQQTFSHSFFEKWMQKDFAKISHYATKSTDTWNQVDEKPDGIHTGGIFTEPFAGTSYIVKGTYTHKLAKAVMGATVARSILGDAYAPLDKLAYCGDDVCITSKIIPGFNASIYNSHSFFVYNVLSSICSSHSTHLKGLDAARLVDWIVQHNDLHASNSGIIQDASGLHITVIDFDSSGFPMERKNPVPCNKQEFKAHAQQWLATDVQALILEQFTAIVAYTPQLAPQLIDIEASLLASQRDLAEFLNSDIFWEVEG